MTLSDRIDSDDAWVPGLARFLKERREVDAILLDAKRKKISVGTMGSVDEEVLKRCLRETLLAIEAHLIKGGSMADLVPQGFTVEAREGRTLLQREHESDASEHKLQWREMPWPEVEVHDHEEDWRILAVLAGVCGVSGLMGYILHLLDVGPGWLPIVLYLLAMVAGGWDAGRDVWHDLPRGKLDIHFLMLAVALGAMAIGAWKEGALLLFLFSFSGALEQFAKYRTRGAIDSLFKMAPTTGLVLGDDGEEREVPLEKVVPGDTVVIKPGQLFPVDGEVRSGKSAADESNLTGEARPIEKGVGDVVYSGTMNLWGAVQAKVLRPASESSLQKIIRLIQEAQHLKAPSQRFTDRFGTPYTYGILGLTFVMFFVWWLGVGVRPFINDVEGYSAFYRAMTLLVVASPCALVLSIPSAILAAIAWGASHGILFRGGAAIEKLSEIDVVALDKTGTLTTGELKVERVESFPPGREEEVAEKAFSLERNASHPIARAIVAYGKGKGLREHVVNEFKSLTGKGVQGHFDEGLCILGRRALLEVGPLAEWAKALPPADAVFTEVWVIYGDLIGRLLLKDSIRQESRPVLEKLRELKIKTVMLTGDRRETAESVGKELGLQEVQYGLSPEDKVNIISTFTQSGKKVAMVGDGVNDAPSLAAAYVSVAMGARGSDAALEQSEVVLMNDRIDYFLNAYALSLKAHRIIRINLGISLISIITMVLAASFGLVPLTVGVLTHEGSTVFVCLNSLRLLFYRVRF